MAEYVTISSDGQITLPATIRRAAKLQEGDLLEATVQQDGSILLVPKSVDHRKLVEKPQLKDIKWALKQKKAGLK